MSQSLTPFEGENRASYEALKTAIRLAEGFTLIFAVTNTEAGAQEVMRRLWHDGVRYQKAWLRDPERPLVDQVVESVRSAQLPVMVLGLEGLTTMPELLSRSLQNLNWTRPQWATRLPQTIVFWITTNDEAAFAKKAPDLWRFRSLRAEFKFGLLPIQARVIELRKRLRSLELAPRIHLKTLIELFNLTRDQSPLSEAVRLVGATPDLPTPSEFEYLRRLKLHGSNHTSVVSLGPLPRLESIELEYTCDWDFEVAELLELSRPIRLRRGVFLEGLIGEKTILALSKLPHFSQLEWTSETRRSFDGGLLRLLKNLRSLSLYMPESNDSDFREISEISDLSTLLLNTCWLSEGSLAKLSNLQRLWHLDLLQCGVTSQGLLSISQLKGLRSLSLIANPISDEHLLSLGNLPSIRTIHLAETEVTERGVSRLRAHFAAQRRKVEVIL